MHICTFFALECHSMGPIYTMSKLANKCPLNVGKAGNFQFCH